MGLFELIFGKQKKNPQGSVFGLLNGYTAAFTTFDGEIYEAELVRSAIDAKARHISKLKVEMHGSANMILKNKLKHAPNEWQTWSQLLYRISTILDSKNNAFIVPVLECNEVQGITVVEPALYELIDVQGEPWIRFTFNNGSKAAIELSRVGIMTRFQNKSDYFGETNDALMPTMQLINIQNQTIEESAKNAATYSFMANVNNFAKAEDLAKERKRFSEKNLRKGNGGLLLFPNTYSNVQQVKPTTFSLDANQMEVIKSNVYGYFGVNENVIQNKAIGDELDAFFNGSIEPFAIQLEEVLTKMLFTTLEQSNGNHAHVVSNRLQYMTTNEKVSFATTAQQMGMMKINEYRELFNLEPLCDEVGEQIPARGEYYNVTNGKKLGESKGENDGE